MAKRIEELDRNFQVEAVIQKDGLSFYNAENEPFSIHGVFREGDRFRRIPEAVAKATSEGVGFLHTNTAGGRVRFRTNSTRVAIMAKMPAIGRMPHFALSGSAGFDLYVDNVYAKTFIPPYDMVDGYENCQPVGDRAWREITVNLPLYSDVSLLHIGLDEDAAVAPPTPYVNEVPVVYYGSSITQGGCASRPGCAYQAVVSRALHCDYINLGFSGNARAEEPMIAYIKNLPMGVFVYDYDHNAPSPEYLQATHEKMFRAIRETQPELPVVMLSAPIFAPDEWWAQRRAIVKETYRNALAAGDKNVYYIDGTSLMALCGNEGTVDDCHPTDLGFASMAAAVTEVLRPLLGE